jgi:hypothetical protein
MPQPAKSLPSWFPVRRYSPRKGNPRIALPVKKTNIDAVRSFMLECLAPLLAEEFLRHQSHAESSEIEPIGKNRLFDPLAGRPSSNDGKNHAK